MNDTRELIERLHEMENMVRPFDADQALTYHDCAYLLQKAADALKSLADENERLRAVVEAAKRIDQGHWFAEGGYIPESDWIALMNALKHIHFGEQT